MKKGGGWTPERDALLKLALDQKTSVQRLAVRLKVSQSSIRSRARALGFVLPAIPKLPKKEYRPRWVAKRSGRRRRCDKVVHN